MSDYDHTQRGVLHWMLVAFAVAAALGGVALRDLDDGALALWALAAVFGALAACFAHLRIRDTGDALRVQFGPLAVFGRTLRYADIGAATPDRTILLDGWGIHWIPGRGWTWNIHGFPCVRVDLRAGGVVRLGTDDPQGLAAFLATRIAA